jgi:shikimate 5-dehydrogenase
VIVGCGGTGSAVAEQLLRLGVRNLKLVDPDELSCSNVTRVYGSRLLDVGRPKVDVLAEHLEARLPDTHVQRLRSMITVESTARELADAEPELLAGRPSLPVVWSKRSTSAPWGTLWSRSTKQATSIEPCALMTCG